MAASIVPFERMSGFPKRPKRLLPLLQTELDSLKMSFQPLLVSWYLHWCGKEEEEGPASQSEARGPALGFFIIFAVLWIPKI